MKKKIIFWIGLVAAILSISASIVALKNVTDSPVEVLNQEHKHNFSIVETIKSPTCFSPGEELHSCSCGELFMKGTPTTSHFISNNKCIYCDEPAITTILQCNNNPAGELNLSLLVVEGTMWSDLDNVIINDMGYVLYKLDNGAFAFVRVYDSSLNRYVCITDGIISNMKFDLSYYGIEGYMDIDPNSLGEYWISYIATPTNMGYGYIRGAQVKLKYGSNFNWYDNQGNLYHGSDIVVMDRDHIFYEIKPSA